MVRMLQFLRGSADGMASTELKDIMTYGETVLTLLGGKSWRFSGQFSVDLNCEKDSFNYP